MTAGLFIPFSVSEKTSSSVGDLQQRLEGGKGALGDKLKTANLFLESEELGKPKDLLGTSKQHTVYQEIANNFENIAQLIRRVLVLEFIRIVNFVRNCFCVVLSCFVCYIQAVV